MFNLNIWNEAIYKDFSETLLMGRLEFTFVSRGWQFVVGFVRVWRHIQMAQKCKIFLILFVSISTNSNLKNLKFFQIGPLFTFSNSLPSTHNTASLKIDAEAFL